MFDQFNNFISGLIVGWVTALPILKWLFGDQNVIPRLMNWWNIRKYHKNNEDYNLTFFRQGDNVIIKNTGSKPVKIIDMIFDMGDNDYFGPNSKDVSEYVKKVKNTLLGTQIKPLQQIQLSYIRGDIFFKLIYTDLRGKYKDSVTWRTSMF